MTRYHYIKKCMYLQYRLLMLPNTIHSLYGHYDTSYAKWNSMVPPPPFHRWCTDLSGGVGRYL